MAAQCRRDPAAAKSRQGRDADQFRRLPHRRERRNARRFALHKANHASPHIRLQLDAQPPARFFGRFQLRVKPRRRGCLINLQQSVIVARIQFANLNALPISLLKRTGRANHQRLLCLKHEPFSHEHLPATLARALNELESQSSLSMSKLRPQRAHRHTKRRPLADRLGRRRVVQPDQVAERIKVRARTARSRRTQTSSAAQD